MLHRDVHTLLRAMRLSYGTPGLVMMLHSVDMFIVGISLLYWMTPSKMSARFAANKKISFSTSRGLQDEKSFSSFASLCSLISRSMALNASFYITIHLLLYTYYCTFITVHLLLYTYYCTLITVHLLLSVHLLLYTYYCTIITVHLLLYTY